jgi:hypothetical protein
LNIMRRAYNKSAPEKQIDLEDAIHSQMEGNDKLNVEPPTKPVNVEAEMGATAKLAPRAVDFAMAERFLQMLDPTAKYFWFRRYTDTKDKSFKAPQRDGAMSVRGTFAEWRERLAVSNANGDAIHVVVNHLGPNHAQGWTKVPGQPDADNVICYRAVWADFDNGHFPDNLPMEPSIINKTKGPNRHVYFLTSEPLTRAEHATIQKIISIRYGSDRGANDAERVLRIPGFWHLKNSADPQFVETLKVTRGLDGSVRRYSKAELFAAFPLLTETELAAEAARAEKAKRAAKAERDAKAGKTSASGDAPTGGASAVADQPKASTRERSGADGWTEAQALAHAEKCVALPAGHPHRYGVVRLVQGMLLDMSAAPHGTHDTKFMRQALALGNLGAADGYLDRDASCEALIDAVHAAPGSGEWDNLHAAFNRHWNKGRLSPYTARKHTRGPRKGLPRGWDGLASDPGEDLPPAFDLGSDADDETMMGAADEASSGTGGADPYGAIDVDWIDLDAKGQKPVGSVRNVAALLDALGAKLYWNEFDRRTYMEGYEYFTKLNDAALNAFKVRAHTCGLRMQDATFKSFVLELARRNRRHPIKEWLADLEWDGVERLDNWQQVYFGSPDTPFLRATGRIVFTAICRRVLEPGIKFDTVPILESPEGYSKSSALRLIAGDDHFTDNMRLGDEAKIILENTRGRLIVEIPELVTGIKRDPESAKAQTSRQEDDARMAYASDNEPIKRAFVIFGTTNETNYLPSQTGNRRFWPTPVGRIDVAALARDRDQLFAEAYLYALRKESITLPENLWASAEVEQEARRLRDPLEDILVDAIEHKEGFIPTDELLKLLCVIEPTKRRGAAIVIKRTLNKHGWTDDRKTAPWRCQDGKPVKLRGYLKGNDDIWFVTRVGAMPGDPSSLVAMVSPI